MSYATSAHTVFDQTLGMLGDILAKAAGHDAGDALLAAKLADDMFPLAMQVRFTGHQVVNTLNRLAGGDHPLADTDPATIADARAHIADLRAMNSAHGPEGWLKSDARVEFDLPNGMAFAMEAHEYVRDWSLPNFYFHATTAYAILRREGLAIGKGDFLPHMMQYFVKKPD
jgi:hypothetical protein